MIISNYVSSESGCFCLELLGYSHLPSANHERSKIPVDAVYLKGDHLYKLYIKTLENPWNGNKIGEVMGGSENC